MIVLLHRFGQFLTFHVPNVLFLLDAFTIIIMQHRLTQLQVVLFA